jgi:hypothetical protein
MLQDLMMSSVLDLGQVHVPALRHEDAEFQGHGQSLNTMAVEVRCTPDGDSYRCTVTVSEGGSSTRHQVRVTRRDIDRWARGRSADDLVRDSFAFLLQREPKESILREFDLSVIQRYFPDFDGG